MTDTLPLSGSAVGVDTMIFSWLFRDALDITWSEDDKWKWVLSRHLLHQLKAKKCDLLVPAIVLGESLAGLPLAKQQVFFDQIKSRCRFEQFDQWSAFQGARIYRQFNGFKDLGIARNVVKADVQIIATLKGKVSCFYSHDVNCRKIANRAGLPALDLPWPVTDWVDEQELMDQVGLKKGSKPTWVTKEE